MRIGSSILKNPSDPIFSLLKEYEDVVSKSLLQAFLQIKKCVLRLIRDAKVALVEKTLRRDRYALPCEARSGHGA